MRETVDRASGWGGFGMGGAALVWMMMGGPSAPQTDQELQEVREAIKMMSADIRTMSADVSEMRDEQRDEHALLRQICVSLAPDDAGRAACLQH